MSEQRTPGPEHRRLDLFVGNWETAGTIRVDPVRPPVGFHAVDTYEWLPGGFFLLHRWDAHMPSGRTQGVEIIGYDSVEAKYRATSFDSEGNSDSMISWTEGETWIFEGKSLRFEGSFTDDGTVLAGIWKCREAQGESWEHLMDVRLTKNALPKPVGVSKTP